MTIAPRWRKVLGDIADGPVRTAVAVLAMAAGVFGIGAILTSYSILDRELPATYGATHPASAILVLDGVDDALVASARRLEGVAEAEGRALIRGRIRVGEGEWAPLILFVIRDFGDQRIDTFEHEEGGWPPKDGEVLLERSALGVARAEIGDDVTVQAAEGAIRTLRVAGTVHAAGLAPAWMEHTVYGFVGWTSVMRAEKQAESDSLRIVTAEGRLDAIHIEDVADQVKGWLESQGRNVARVDVPPPGRHPHADQMETFLFLLGGFGALTFVLAAVLVANMIHALLTKQVRQVGVMKVLGATSGQIAALYLAQVSILSAAALAIGMPLGFLAGRGYARFAGAILNATISSASVPLWVVALQIAAGFGLPLIAALGPVVRASRITIHEAFSGGLGHRPFGSRPLDRWLARLVWLPRPLRLSLRTAFDRRVRLALTVGTLAAGGAVFISALNVGAAWSRALDQDARSRRYDIDVRLTRPTSVDLLDRMLKEVPDVAHVEYWSEADASLIVGAGGVGAGGGSGAGGAGGEAGRAAGRVYLAGPDENSQILHLPILSGRWLEPGDGRVVVANQALMALHPSLRVGGDASLRVKGRIITWRIVGVAREIVPVPTAYAPAAAVLEAKQEAAGMTRNLRIVMRRHDADAQLSAQRDLERALSTAGVGVAQVFRLLDLRQGFEDHLVIIRSALLLAALLVVLVGGLGLATTLTLNVVERTREIGVLSAIGATPGTISRHVLAEGMVMGLLSFGVALVAAVPVTQVFDTMTGSIFIKSPLDFFMSPGGAAAWLALVVVLAGLSSFYPARRAARLAVREALAYE